MLLARHIWYTLFESCRHLWKYKFLLSLLYDIFLGHLHPEKIGIFNHPHFFVFVKNCLVFSINKKKSTKTLQCYYTTINNISFFTYVPEFHMPTSTNKSYRRKGPVCPIVWRPCRYDILFSVAISSKQFILYI